MLLGRVCKNFAGLSLVGDSVNIFSQSLTEVFVTSKMTVF